MKPYTIFYLLTFLMLLSSCDENKINVNLNWQELLGDYTGEFTYGMQGDNTDYWFAVDRNVSLEQISSDNFKIIFNDTSYNSVAYYQTYENPFLDTVFYKQLHLNSLELEFIKATSYQESKQGTVSGSLKIITKDYQEYSGLIGFQYFNDPEKKESIHIILERFLPVGADLVDSIESITFHAYRK